MTVTLTWEGIVLTLLAAAGIVFLIYLSLLIKKLIGTLKEVDVILKDSQVITTIAAEKATKVDGIIDGISIIRRGGLWLRDTVNGGFFTAREKLSAFATQQRKNHG